MSQDSPSAELTKTGRKYQRFNNNKQEWENTEEHGKKYENRNELKEDMAELYEDIFKYRSRKANKNKSTFLGVLAKKLTVKSRS